MADLARAVNIADLRRLAQRRLPRAIFDFFDGGAEDEVTLRENRAAFARVRLLPKVLVNVAKVDTTVSLFNKTANLPLAIAPTGGISAGRYGAELILARAAKAWGVPFTMATPSAFSIERLAEDVGGRLWFQLYCVRNLEFRAKLVRRARDAGYEAILVTVDLPVSGKRERDPRNGFHTPYSPNWRNSRDVLFRPAWALDMLRNGLPGMANMEGYPFSAASGTDIVTAVGREMDAGLDWEYIKQLRDQWPGKLLLKGVERPDDARARRRGRLRRRRGLQPRRAPARRCHGDVGRPAEYFEGGRDQADRVARRRGTPRRRHPQGARPRRAGRAHGTRYALRRDGGRRSGSAPRARDPFVGARARDAALRCALGRRDRRRAARYSERRKLSRSCFWNSLRPLNLETTWFASEPVLECSRTASFRSSLRPSCRKKTR